MEKIDLYRRDFVKTKQTLNRGMTIPGEHYSLIVFVGIFNREGKMLIQQRSFTKIGWPGLWDISVGGAVKHKETSAMAARRETLEELGIDLPEDRFSKVLSLYYDKHIHDIYSVCVEDIPLEDLKLQKGEVESARWATREEILGMISDGSFIHVYKEFISLLFLMREKKGILDET